MAAYVPATNHRSRQARSWDRKPHPEPRFIGQNRSSGGGPRNSRRCFDAAMLARTSLSIFRVDLLLERDFACLSENCASASPVLLFAVQWAKPLAHFPASALAHWR